MPELFMYEDILNTLIELEKRGAALYEKLATSADTIETQKLMHFLSQQEVAHQHLYEGIKAERFVKEEEDESYRGYIEALLDQTYQMLTSAETSGITYSESIRRAKSIEMATLVLLNEFKKLMPHHHENDIERLMDEERGHLQLLFKLEKQKERESHV